MSDGPKQPADTLGLNITLDCTFCRAQCFFTLPVPYGGVTYQCPGSKSET